MKRLIQLVKWKILSNDPENMKRIIITLVYVFAISSNIAAQNADSDSINNTSSERGIDIVRDSLSNNRELTVADGDSAYIKADYLTAIRIYEEILNDKGFSAGLYMNLGNAYYKKDEIAKAILCYERAYLLDPSDSNIKFNLELARTKTVDRVVPINQLFLIVWVNKLISVLNINQWSVMIILLFIVALLSLGVYFFTKKRTIKKISFYFLSIFFVFSILSYIFASTQMNDLKHRDTAIIMSPSVTVKSTPSENGTELFIIHEGRKVKIIDDSMKEWVEIELEDGNTGWIQVREMEII